jgi:transposase-like protein
VCKLVNRATLGGACLITMLMCVFALDNFLYIVYTLTIKYREDMAMKYVRLTDQERVYIVKAYETDLARMIDLAKQHGVTRQCIYKVLKQAGVNTHRGEGGATQIHYSCTVCGKEGIMARARFRKRKHVFCGEECYFAWLKHGNGNPLIMHRTGARHARAIVSGLFSLRPGNVVHHEDRNQFNNALYNLKVFAYSGDHLRYHRGFDVPILWDGSKV